MKKLLVLFVSVLFMSCTPDSDNSSMESSISVGSDFFVPKSFRVQNGTSNNPGEGSLVFSLKRGSANTSGYEALIFTVRYPLSSSSAPTGTYSFNPGSTSSPLNASGTYMKANNTYILTDNTVKVTAFGNKKYKLEFQNIEAEYVSNNEIKIISGYCEGDFK